MKALVTGGSGFIGSNIVKLLLKNGWDVRIIDNLSSGHKSNLDGLDIEFVEGDICDADLVEKCVRSTDAVFHLAASVGRQRSLDYPVVDAMMNVIGTLNVLEAMKKHSVNRIVYSSSAAIFGELTTPAIAEDHPQNADCPYGVTKLAAEKMILAYSGLYDIIGVCLRYFNIYGINQRYDAYGNVIPIFAHNIYHNLPIKIYGDGLQTRDFLNVQDVASANFLAATKVKQTDVFNLGSGSSITINALATMMKRLSDQQDAIIEYAPKRPADVLHCKADIDKAKRIFGYEPSVDLEAGVRDYLAWYSVNCLNN